MTILHVYDENDTLIAQYVHLLCSLAADSMLMQQATSLKAFRQQAATQPPDVVHVHGRPPFSVPAGHRLVVTPHGMAPATARPYVVVARSTLEHQRLTQQFARVETVLNPLITRSISPETFIRQMTAVYQRVMDSYVLELMTADTRRALAHILAAALYGDRRWVEPLPHYTLHLPPEALRQLCIYARLEGVPSLLDDGLRLLGTAIPAPPATTGYQPADYHIPQPAADRSVAALLTDIKVHGPSLLRLCELHQTLLSDQQLDEALLMRQLTDRGLNALMASCMQLMSEQTLLAEGFMPCPPTNDRLTQQLRTQLATRQAC